MTYLVPWGYHQYRRNILSTLEMFNTVRVFSIVGDIIFCYLSTVGGYHDTCGGDHEYRGGVQYCGGTQKKMIFPYGTEHHHGTHDIPPRYS